jgi:hypothetical protein
LRLEELSKERAAIQRAVDGDSNLDCGDIPCVLIRLGSVSQIILAGESQAEEPLVVRATFSSLSIPYRLDDKAELISPQGWSSSSSRRGNRIGSGEHQKISLSTVLKA